jgi:hypothetical protein
MMKCLFCFEEYSIGNNHTCTVVDGIKIGVNQLTQLRARLWATERHLQKTIAAKNRELVVAREAADKNLADITAAITNIINGGRCDEANLRMLRRYVECLMSTDTNK